MHERVKVNEEEEEKKKRERKGWVEGAFKKQPPADRVVNFKEKSAT